MPAVADGVTVPLIHFSQNAWQTSDVRVHYHRSGHPDAYLPVAVPRQRPQAFIAACTKQLQPKHFDTSWAQAWLQRSHQATEAIDACAKHLPWGEAAATYQLCHHTTQQQFVHEKQHENTTPAWWHVGNSLPIRLASLFLENAKISSNRGVNGIDGQLATAIGRNWGVDDPKHQPGESAAPGRVWLGDGTLLHDASSLYLETSAPPIELCCIANDGGRIFDLLPAAQATDPQLTRASNPRFDPLAACRCWLGCQPRDR